MKNVIEISTGKVKGYREREYIFKTDQDIPLEYFSCRRSLSAFSFPRYVEGTVENYCDSNGGMCEWKDFNDFADLKIQNIKTIKINGENINDAITRLAEEVGATVKFPLIYHIQFIFKKNPTWVFNWYPTTGTLSKQKTTDNFYRMKNLGVYEKVKDALTACVTDIS